MMMVIIWLMMVIISSGWRFQPTPLKHHGVKVSWDDDIPFPTEWKVIKHVPVTTNQCSLVYKPL